MDVPAAPVKDRFTALDTLALTREIRRLVGGRVDKAFTATPAGVSLLFRVPRAGRHELHIVSGRYASLRAGAGEHADELDPLAKELRRLLAGAQLTEVADPLGERYLECVFRRPDVEGTLRLGVELFGHGNLVVARNDTIAAVEHTRRWAHRSVRVGAEYQRPPSRLNPLALTPAALEGILRQSRTDRATTLAARAGLGGPLSEEVLVRAGLEGSLPATTDAGESARGLARAITELVAAVGDSPRGFLYARGELPLDVSPVRMTRWAPTPGVDERTYDDFSSAAEAYFSALPAETAPAPSPREEARLELERQQEQQRRAVEGLRATVAGLQSQAESILEHYAEVEQALAKVDERTTDDRVEVSVAGQTIPILLHRPVRESAQVLFDEAKRLKAKLAGAEAALRQSEGRLRLAHDLGPPVPSAAAGGGGPAVRPRKIHWFERYRWFVSSEGILVIGGRDAPSNDLIVRRYLNPGDFYVHAEIHGAPSVVVKHPAPGQPGPTEITLREACQWGLAFSKAWRGGIASGDAFWVTPEQVSKAGASGEFVPRGAWVIHGSKNYVRDLPTELALGTTRYEGVDLWTVAPRSALASRGEVRWVLTPGDERERPAREVELSRDLGLSRDRLQSLLPAGGITMRRA